ncbi:MAG: hypothetical protein V2I63_06595 [Pseudomonadales bacterium]|nr:hypothetical protein [Pseudomonadales bacterium]
MPERRGPGRASRCLLLAAALLASLAAAGETVDPATGLIVAPGWRQVASHCGACHSYRLVTAQRGDEAFWRSVIRWMQRTQNLWTLPEDDERAILAYLSTQYAESDWGRRPPLSPTLLPDAGGR